MLNFALQMNFWSHSTIDKRNILTIKYSICMLY